MIRAHHLRDKVHIGVIGGNGFIGRTLIKSLANQSNLRIWSLDKRRSGVVIDTEGSEAVIQQINMDVATPALNPWMCSRPMDMIVYLAGYESVTDGLGETLPDVDGLKALVNTVQSYNNIQTPHQDDVKPYFLYVSSCSVYGQNNVEISSEEDMLVPCNYTGMGKMYCEDIVGRAMTKYNVPWCILRPTEVYGRKHYKELRNLRNWPGYVQYYLDSVVRRQEQIHVFSPETKVDLIHVNYLCQVIVDCLANQRTGIYNVASGKPIKIIDLAERIQELYGEKESELIPNYDLEIEDLTITTGKVGELIPYNHSKYSLNKFIEQYLPIRRLEIAKDLAIEQIVAEPKLVDTSARAAMKYFEKRKERRGIAYQRIREIAGPEQFKYIRYGRFQERARELLGYQDIQELEDLSESPEPAETLGDTFAIEHQQRLSLSLPNTPAEVKEGSYSESAK